METGQDLFTKQCPKGNSLKTTNNHNVQIHSDFKSGYNDMIGSYSKPYLKQCEEPIDLTQEAVKFEGSDSLFLDPRTRKMPFTRENEGFSSAPGSNFFKGILELQTTKTKQDEILKAAKSSFAKRTRTLYRWTYPDTPKQHIKAVVTNSWNNLSSHEKQFYISEVLVKFGFPQNGLMINPQLAGIKGLPVPASVSSTSSRELETAISSISKVIDGKRKQGRPLGSKNKKQKADLMAYRVSKDFQDDPELSKELEKFAVSFDCFK